MKRIRALLAIAAVVAAVHLPAPGADAADAPIVLKFSLRAQPQAPAGRAAERFRQLAEQRTDGRVQVQVFAGSSLYGPEDELEALQLGAVQMVVASLRNLSALGLSDFDALELPYLFDSYEALHRVTDGPVGAALLGKLANSAALGLAFWDMGFKQLTANRPVRFPGDARGLSIRTTYSRISDLEVRVLGASPQPIAFTDLRDALATGAVDGTELVPQFIDAGRLDEVQKYMTLSNHGYLGSVLVANRRFWQRLPAGVRTALESAARDATAFANEAVQREEAQALRDIGTRGHMQVITLDARQRDEWKHALLDVHRQGRALIPADTLSAIYQATGFKPQ
jgi:C4-dicarboxylate-binding protein DctP